MVGCSHLDQYKGQNRCVHSMVQPPWDKVVKQSWVYHLSVIGIDGPEHRNNKNPDREGQHGQRPVPERDELPELSFLLLVPAASGQKTREVGQHTDAEEHGLDNLEVTSIWYLSQTQTGEEYTGPVEKVPIAKHKQLTGVSL